jgi:hypothetical protein
MQKEWQTATKPLKISWHLEQDITEKTLINATEQM